MITDLLLNVLLNFIRAVTYPITAQQNVSLPDSIVTSFGSAAGYYSALDAIIPVGTLLICVGIILGFEFALKIYEGIMWLLKKIPGIS